LPALSSLTIIAQIDKVLLRVALVAPARKQRARPRLQANDAGEG